MFSSVYGKAFFNRKGRYASSGGTYFTAMVTERPSSFLKLAQKDTFMSVLRWCAVKRGTRIAPFSPLVSQFDALISRFRCAKSASTTAASRWYGCSYLAISCPPCLPLTAAVSTTSRALSEGTWRLIGTKDARLDPHPQDPTPFVHDLFGHGFAVLLPDNDRMLISDMHFWRRIGRGQLLKLLHCRLGVWDTQVHTPSLCMDVVHAPVLTGPERPVGERARSTRRVLLQVRYAL